MQYVAIAKFIFSIFPLLLKLIKEVEAQFPDSDQGNAKREAVIAMLEAAFDVATDVVSFNFADVQPALEKTIGGIVKFLNKTNSWDKKPEEAKAV